MPWEHQERYLACILGWSGRASCKKQSPSQVLREQVRADQVEGHSSSRKHMCGSLEAKRQQGPLGELGDEKGQEETKASHTKEAPRPIVTLQVRKSAFKSHSTYF